MKLTATIARRQVFFGTNRMNYSLHLSVWFNFNASQLS